MRHPTDPPSNATYPRSRYFAALVAVCTLAALALWFLNKQLDAGVGVESATLAVTAVLVCAGRVVTSVIAPGNPPVGGGAHPPIEETRG